MSRRKITLKQAAEQYGVCTATIRRRAAAGELTVYRSGRLIRLDADEVDGLFKPA